MTDYEDDVLVANDSGPSDDSAAGESWLAEQVRLITLEDGLA